MAERRPGAASGGRYLSLCFGAAGGDVVPSGCGVAEARSMSVNHDRVLRRLHPEAAADGRRRPNSYCKLGFTVKVVEDNYGLGAIADEIDDLREQLEDAYGSRVEAILEALADGHSLREVAEHLRMSHTAVAKALDGI